MRRACNCDSAIRAFSLTAPDLLARMLLPGHDNLMEDLLYMELHL